MKWLQVTLVGAVVIAAAGCATGPTQEQTGAVVGGALGGVLGAQVGGGTGRTAAIIAGTLAGAMIGGAIGRSMDRTDQMMVSQTLETVPDRQTRTWQNPNTGTSFQATPTNTFQTATGQDCREYRIQGDIDGRLETITGVACRRPDGTWVNQ